MDCDRFTGPLFVVGMPRSGTKLLRGMLNQHPNIRVAVIETEFFPFWVSNWDRLGANEGPKGFERFYDRCMHLPFFVQYAERGISIDREEWLRSCEAFTPAAVFEALLRQVLSISDGDASTIWADKSPSYLRHVPLLIENFPAAKVLHVVRDVRDCCLSARKAWGKNMLRVAQRWQDDVSRCRQDGRSIPSAYMELRYEDLLADTETVLTEICGFLGVPFLDQMLTTDSSTENLGDAKGMTTLLKSNVQKYQSSMPPGVASKIESIACDTLRELEYPCTYTGQAVRIPEWRLRLLQATDGVGLFRRLAKKRGWLPALKLLVEDFWISGNRDR